MLRATESLYELRITIETAAALRLLRNRPDGAVAALRARIEDLRRAAGDPSDTVGQIDADMAFHRAICALCGNPRFTLVFDQIANETKLGLMLIGRLSDDATLIAETHESIAAGDAVATAASIAHHIGTARDLVVPLIRNRDRI